MVFKTFKKITAKQKLLSKPLSKKLIAASQAMDRRPSEKAILESRGNRNLKLAVFLGMLAATVALFGPALYQSFVSMNKNVEPIGAHPDLWSVVYDSDGGLFKNCGELPLSRDCIAHPRNKTLWSSSVRRASQAHRKWVHDNPGQGFWLGAQYSREALQKAFAEGANQLLLGYMVGEAKVWVNGDLYYTQDTRPLTPTVVSLPLSSLQSGLMSVAIYVEPHDNIAYPDFLNAVSGGEGLISISTVDIYKGYQDFINRVRPFGLYIGNFLIALLFIFFWANVPIKQEYFYLALFALIESTNQLRIVDWVRQPLVGSGLTYHYQFLSRLLQGLLTVYLGMAFSRKTRAAFIGVFIGFSIFSSFLIVLNPDATMQFRLAGLLAQYWIPLSAIIGATVCFVTAYTLSSDHLRRDFLALRIRRLFSFGAALVVFGLIQYLFGNTVSVFGKTGVVQYFAYFSSVVALGAITIRDYRESEQLRNDLTSLSEILELARSKKPVSGAALYIDLKGSEHLIREGEARGDAGIYLRRIMKSLCDAIGQSGGVRFTIDGDMIKSFFPNRANGAGVAVAMDGVRTTMQALEKETKVLRSEGVLSANRTLAARFGLAVGNVQALIVDTGPIFEHVDDTSPLLDAARMLHIEEKEFSDQKSTSFVVMTTESKALLENKDLSNLGTWIGPEIQANAKHGVVYEAAVFKPHQSHSIEDLKKAA